MFVGCGRRALAAIRKSAVDSRIDQWFNQEGSLFVWGDEMTLRELLRSMGTRWYVLVAMLVVAGAAGALLLRDGGIYATRTAVVFTLPGQTLLLPDSGARDASVIAFADGVAQDINGGEQPFRYAGADAPFYGAGVREGIAVSLRNEGGQWVTSFGAAQIEVQIVGRTREWVQDKQEELVAQVLSTSDARQAEAGIAPEERIAASVVPLTSAIDEIHPSRSAIVIAFAALVAAAVAMAAWGSTLLDRIAARGGVPPRAARIAPQRRRVEEIVS
ncbi:hypothetical protein [Microbacterium telephonicum]|uniref:Uncharacterized protein n=1 Tax=Microbacterium telephonicum TaxID=1714841 RepID=A0A498BWW2_9MICO|nr:hypothetical protein [Microbacterium telephonicum]RLK47945.1 hypothetical protein C7474_2544 [Microbacterium telephonicum]